LKLLPSLRSVSSAPTASFKRLSNFSASGSCGILSFEAANASLSFLIWTRPASTCGSEKKHRVADRFGFSAGKDVRHFGMHIARPRPAADIGDALIVDGDDGDTVQRRTRCGSDPEIVGLALETLDQVAAGCYQEHQGHHQSEKPIGFPKTQIFHPSDLVLYSFSSGLTLMSDLFYDIHRQSI
jgi:hypothetical protein